MHPIITKTEDADTAEFYFQPSHIGCSIVVDGELGVNTIPVVYVGADGLATTTATNADGDDLELTAANPSIPIYFACKVQIQKPATSGLSIGVNIHGME